ncbi:MAG: hypothetical protein H7Z14_08550 [Anaerolineae bacterium]|nr:hypothetical protein [Phycisphaerae bacterium]
MSSSILHSKISNTRRKHVSFRIGVGLAAAVALLVGAIGVEMMIDWQLDLPRWMRAGALGLTMLALTYVIVRHILIPLIWSPDDDEVALWVERALPALRSRLIASVQLMRPNALPAGASVGMVRALVKETEAVAEPFDFSVVVTAKPVRRMVMLATLIVIVASTGMVRAGNDGIDLLKRAFLVPGIEVPRKTRVTVSDPRQLIARGDVVTIRARAEGVIPENGTVEVRSPDQRTQSYLISRDAGSSNEFVLTIQNAQRPFEYVVQLNDGRSAICRVDVAERPAVTMLRCKQIYPKYTGLGEVDRAPGDLSILAGSKLAIDVTSNKDLDRAGNRVRLHGAEKDAPLPVDPNNPRHLGPSEVQLLKGATGLSIHLTDTQGITSKDSAVYRVEIVSDQPPSLRMTSPNRREDLVTKRAQIVVAMDAADDYGLARLSIRYKVAGSSAEPKRIELDLPPRAKSFRGYYPLKIDALSPLPTEGQTIEWWVEADDANDVTGPGKTESEHFIARVVSDEEKRADLMSRLGNYLDQINEVSENQRELSAKLGQLITEKK